MVQKILLKKIMKVLLSLGLFCIVGFAILIGFYIWMIYGIHPSDEGTGSVASEYDTKQKKYTSIVITTIINQKRIKIKGKESDCTLHLNDG